MEQRWSNVVIVLFWIASMTWLVVEKVLPPFDRGDPPSVASQLEGIQPDSPPIGWNVLWNNEAIGMATTRVSRSASGVTELYSRVRFWKIPLDEIAPPVLRPLLRNRVQTVDATSRIEFDPLNRISGIYSRIGNDEVPNAVVLQGIVEGDRLKLQVNPGKAGWSPPVYLPRSALLGDEMSPQARMPGLHVGQTWTSPVYNPFRQLTDSPLEILQATVEGHETISWNGLAVDTLLIVYRGDPGAAFGAARTPRGKMWVDRDGVVLRQELAFSGARLTFLRMTAAEASEIAEPFSDPPRRPAYSSGGSYNIESRADAQ